MLNCQQWTSTSFAFDFLIILFSNLDFNMFAGHIDVMGVDPNSPSKKVLNSDRAREDVWLKIGSSSYAEYFA